MNNGVYIRLIKLKGYEKILFLLLFTISFCQSICAQQIINVPIFDGGEQTPTPHPRSTTIVPIQCFFNPVICEVCLIFQTDLGMVDIVITNITNMTDTTYYEDSCEGTLYLPVDEGQTIVSITTTSGQTYYGIFYAYYSE